MKKHFLYWLVLGLIVIIGCQKESSFELGNTPAEGSLQSDVTGDCLPKTINGTYVATTPLVPTTNSITVSVNVTRTGTYIITTDTINGYFFRGTGTFTALGPTNVTLRGNGTPFAAGIDNFVVSYDSTICDIAVTVLPAGAGGPAVFTLDGAPATCIGAVVNGSYAISTALTATNTVTINVTVTTIGTYNITTTYQGMTFTKSGTFTTLGANTVTLVGSGTPTTAGVNTVPLPVGATTCSFVVNVSSPAVGTLGGSPAACTPSTVNGIYVVGTPMAASNSVQIQISVTTAGVYSISTNTVTGFSFAGTGTVAVGPNQLINLAATGTPTTAGPQTFLVTFGTSTCTFVVNVLPNDYFPRTTGSNWSYEFDDNANDSLYRNAITPTLAVGADTYNIFMQNDGVTPPPDSSGYYRRSGGDYFEWFDAGAYIGYNPPAVWSSYIMVKDNVAAGTNWKSGGFAGVIAGPPPTPLNIRFSFTIPAGQKDIAVTVVTSLGTVTYQNVIVVEEKFEVEVTPGVWQDATTTLDFYGKSYYARGVGLIKYEALNAAGTVQNTQELRRFQVL
ncbi:MAG: hypothetical protein IPF69_10580 [Chitinophagaceae bacterium]|nr:hypothetical protein [Chitinophagaceae bacterium]MBK7679429.1 hypothetical protein [Chitinophagaceae bacterium]MBK8299223.1 hypothetical protein [Chitinophagaceae bacterium]MBK9463275.1 hypothetical protein [Chitinophagaceae bacterium]MBL0068573.1 hypothetical protein [Chitinophagaceae bacterium]